MTPRAFYELVKDLRKAQRESQEEKHTNFDAISKSKHFEAMVDAEIDRVEKILAKREEASKVMDKAVKLLERKGFEVVEDNRKMSNNSKR